MTIKARVLTRFPARAQGQNGIGVEKAAGIHTIKLDLGSLTDKLSIATGERDNLYVVLYDSTGTPTYVRASLDVILTMIGAGLDPTLVAIAGLSPIADQGVYFSGADSAALYSLTASGRALAALIGAVDKIPYFNGSGSADITDFPPYGRSLIAVASEAAFKTLVNLEIGIDVQAYDATLAALAALDATAGILVQTGADTFARRTWQAPAAGITITNPAGTLGNPTLALADDLLAVEGLGTTGIVRRTGANAWSAGTKVSYAEIQNISATSRILGRKTAGAGDAEELTLSDALDLIGSAAQGDILYRGVSGWERLGAGTSGYFLKTQGAGANPAWAVLPGGGDMLTTTYDPTGQATDIFEALANLGAASAHGRCQLLLSAGNLVLKPKDGNTLTVNGVLCTIPDAGVSLPATGAAPNTLYYIYALATAGVVSSQEFSITPPAVSTTAGNNGVSIKTGDDSRTLVAMAQTDGAGAWDNLRTVSFFNRRRKAAVQSYGAVNGNGPAINIVSWGDEVVSARLVGHSSNVTTALNNSAIQLDGAAWSATVSVATVSTSNLTQTGNANGHAALVSEGAHAIRAAITQSAGAHQYTGNLVVEIMG